MFFIYFLLLLTAVEASALPMSSSTDSFWIQGSSPTLPFDKTAYVKKKLTLILEETIQKQQDLVTKESYCEFEFLFEKAKKYLSYLYLKKCSDFVCCWMRDFEEHVSGYFLLRLALFDFKEQLGSPHPKNITRSLSVSFESYD